MRGEPLTDHNGTDRSSISTVYSKFKNNTLQPTKYPVGFIITDNNDTNSNNNEAQSKKKSSSNNLSTMIYYKSVTTTTITIINKMLLTSSILLLLTFTSAYDNDNNKINTVEESQSHQIIHSQRVPTPSGQELVLDVYVGESVADAVYVFALEYLLPQEIRPVLVEEICEALALTLQSQLFTNSSKWIHNYNDDDDDIYELACERQWALLYDEVIEWQGEEVGLLEIYEDEEPVDVVYAFVQEYYSSDYNTSTSISDFHNDTQLDEDKYSHSKDENMRMVQVEILNRVCAVVECVRYDAVIWHTMVHVQRTNLQEKLQQQTNEDEVEEVYLEIYQNEEPADVIYDTLYPLLSWTGRQKLMQKVIEDDVPYNRDFALVHSIPIHIQSNPEDKSVNGEGVEDEEMEEIVLDIFDDGTEPVDQVYDFIIENELQEYIEVILNTVITQICNVSNSTVQSDDESVVPLLPCTRRVPVVWAQDMYDTKDAYVGTCEIMLQDEPIDIIDAFVTHHQLSINDRDALLHMACGDLNDLYASTYLNKEDEDNESRSNSFVECTRNRPIVFRQGIADANGTKLGTLEVLEEEEVADALARLWSTIPNATNSDNIESFRTGIAMRRYLMNTICSTYQSKKNGRFRCTRSNAIVFDKNITLRRYEDSDNTIEEHQLIIYDIEEPADKVYAWMMDHGLDINEYYSKLMDTVCSPSSSDNGNGDTPLYMQVRRPPMRCNRMAPILFGPQRVTDSENGTIGTLQILYWEEPADAVYAFLAKYNLIKYESWTVHGVLDQICHLPELVGLCNRRKAIKYYNDSFTMGSKYIGEVVIWETEEVVDVLYHLRRQYDLSMNDQIEAMARICEQETVYCGQTRAAILRFTGINHKEFNEQGNATCLRYFAGWQYILYNGDSEDDIDGKDLHHDYDNDSFYLELKFDLSFAKIHEWLRHAAQHKHSKIVLRYASLLELLLIMIIITLSEYGLMKMVSAVTQCERCSRLGRYHRICRMMMIACMAFFVISALHVCGVEPNNSIDVAIHAHEGRLPDLLVYEGDEPVDAILRWVKDTSKEFHPLARQPIHFNLIEEVCGSKIVNCTRRRAWEEIDMGHIVYRNQQHNITYMNPSVDPIGRKNCHSILGGEVDSCVREKAIEVCQRFYPPFPGCIDEISVHISQQLRTFQGVRHNSKNAYTTLELEMDASQGELFQKAAVLVRGNGLNFSPYRRVDNGTDPYPGRTYSHDERATRAYATLDAYFKVKDKESREWHDKPCTPMFGGALCGKKDKDGNLKIEM